LRATKTLALWSPQRHFNEQEKQPTLQVLIV